MSEAEFLADPDAQDVVLRNLQVGIQAALDIALHIVRDEGWELPGQTTAVFDILARHQVVEPDLAGRLRQAVQMRNLLVHAYDAIDHRRVYSAYQESANDLALFGKRVAERFNL